MDPLKPDIAIGFEYLLNIVNPYFKHQLTESDAVWSYSGVRPLMDDKQHDAKKASRDYSFEADRTESKAPVIPVFGGKITTYRKLAEVATDTLCQFFPHAAGPWTKQGLYATEDDLREPDRCLSTLAATCSRQGSGSLAASGGCEPGRILNTDNRNCPS
ncbi:hypothetical protein [Marinobacter orientalis]|uniref:hypothetical protein n=1 Tax=Marinobacter orientalis TaxID=1928859 RepID=UPI00267B028F|nr:hypothetical protein [Marinobacter orientalis]